MRDFRRFWNHSQNIIMLIPAKISFAWPEKALWTNTMHTADLEIALLIIDINYFSWVWNAVVLNYHKLIEQI